MNRSRAVRDYLKIRAVRPEVSKPVLSLSKGAKPQDLPFALRYLGTNGSRSMQIHFAIATKCIGKGGKYF